MIYILLAIFTSTSIALMFKFFEGKNIDSFQTIVFNYYACIALGFFNTEVSISPVSVIGQTWFPFACLIGTLYIVTFYLIAETIKKSGITVATVANKLSMIIPAITAFFIYQNESLSLFKATGIIVAIIAVVLTSIKEKNETDIIENKKFLLLPFILWMLAGISDTVIGYVENSMLTPQLFPTFLASLFSIACILGTILFLYNLITKKITFKFKNLLGGIALGIPNYYSAEFFMKALTYSGLDKSVLFPVISIGIVVLSSLGAYFIFKEHLSTKNVFGIALAIFAIVLMNA